LSLCQPVELNLVVNKSQHMDTIGQSVRRVDAASKVMGQALYPGDINLPGQLWMKILFAGRPHARAGRRRRA
jgi:CO/xanthine dehydrogenase Mo-binding subunit